MKKRYDYHSFGHAFRLLFGIICCLVYFLWHKYATGSHVDVIPVSIAIGILFTATLLGYFSVKNTFIEISDEGILFSGLTKKIYSTWFQVREIKLLGRVDKIYTATGNFYASFAEFVAFKMG